MRPKSGQSCLFQTLCLRCISGFPVVFVVGLLLWAYYAYIVILCGQLIEPVVEKVLLGAVFTALWILVLVAYYRAINTAAGEPPEQFHLSGEQVAEYEAISEEDKEVEIEKKKDLLLQYATNLPPIHTRLPKAGLRYCEKCKLIKPDRTHHCSLCKQCVLKMDHHCPWVNNCVGYGNYKFFILFLMYTMLFCLFTALSALPTFINTWSSFGFHHRNHDNQHLTNSTDTGADDPTLSTSQRLQMIFLFFLAAVFCFSVSFLNFFHVFLLLNNSTTLENGRAAYFTYGQDTKGFHLGHKRNVQQVMGKEVLFWFLPFGRSPGNGYEFPLRRKGGHTEGDRLLTDPDGQREAAVSGEESDHV